MQAQYNALQKAFSTSDFKKCGPLLSQLRIALAQSGLLFPQGTPNYNDLVVARDILEIGAFYSIRTKDIPSFDRYFSQLLSFYTSYSSQLPPSKREYPIRGLHLIRLLTQNRIADFHTTLESLPLPADALSDNPYISHPINLERWLMEGSYSKVWNAREEAPAEEYRYFIDSLMGTIRNEIATCEESAYDSLPLKDAATLLFFTTQSDLLNFAKQRGWNIDLSASKVIFPRKMEEQSEIPKDKLIANNLYYARELEQIV